MVIVSTHHDAGDGDDVVSFPTELPFKDCFGDFEVTATPDSDGACSTPSVNAMMVLLIFRMDDNKMCPKYRFPQPLHSSLPRISYKRMQGDWQ